MTPTEIRARIQVLKDDLVPIFKGAEELRQDPVAVINERVAKGQEIMDIVDKLFKIIELQNELDNIGDSNIGMSIKIDTKIEEVWRSFG